MSSAVYRTSTPSLSVPQTQNTAPVLEYNCLYTHDLRRKQKRWQDGFVRYHTFNKRVMLYDVPRNLIGDTHWTGDDGPQDGDELTLDKGGVLVQVAECCGRTETDLTELKASKKNWNLGQRSSSPVRAMQTPGARPIPATIQTPVAVQSGAPGSRVQLKHRSLNALLGTPKGRIGKASLPMRSPFEERNAGTDNEYWEEGRPPKKPRLAQQHARNITRTTPSKRGPQKEAPLWQRTSDLPRKKSADQGQRKLGTREVIDLSIDADDPTDNVPLGFASDTLAPLSSPQREIATKTPRVTLCSPGPQDHSEPQSDRSIAKRNNISAQQISQDAAPLSVNDPDRHGMPTALANHGVPASKIQSREVERAARSTRVDGGAKDRRQEDVNPIQTLKKPRIDAKNEKLRIASGAPKRKTLLCHTQLNGKPSRVASTNADDGAASLLDVVSQERGQQSRAQRKLLEERLARMKAKDDARAAKQAASEGSTEGKKPMRASTTEPQSEAVSGHGSQGEIQQPVSKSEVARLELGQLDQMLLQELPSPQPTEEPAIIAPKPRNDTILHQAVSEADTISGSKPKSNTKRVAGAPVRYTASPEKAAPLQPAAQAPKHSETQPPAVKRPETQRFAKGNKKQLQRAVSLNTSASGTSTAIFAKSFRTPRSPLSSGPEKPKDLGPWSREASDLFAWRPPGWNEENWCPAADAEQATKAFGK